MSQWPTVQVITTLQGTLNLGPLGGYARVKREDIVAFYVDLPTKNLEVLTTSSGPTGIPEMAFVGPTFEEGPYTQIGFPEYPGWNIHSYTLFGDELAVTLTKS